MQVRMIIQERSSGRCCRVGLRWWETGACLLGILTEKERGNYRSVASRRDFCEFIVGNGLLDLGFIGYPFTWRNRRDEGPIQQRLDRALATSGWVNMYPKAKVMHEVLEGSDHAMLILGTDVALSSRRRRFIYDA